MNNILLGSVITTLQEQDRQRESFARERRKELENHILALKGSGMSNADIARAVGMDKAVVREIIGERP